MKKLLLSIAVIFSFALYSIFARKSAVVLRSAASPVSVLNNGSMMNGPMMSYKDGQYVGDVADAFYGNVQVQASIKGGKITNITFLQYPNDRERSIAINSQAMPYLKQEAIAAQTANVDIISGATATSQAFVTSLASALNQAK